VDVDQGVVAEEAFDESSLHAVNGHHFPVEMSPAVVRALAVRAIRHACVLLLPKVHDGFSAPVQTKFLALVIPPAGGEVICIVARYRICGDDTVCPYRPYVVFQGCVAELHEHWVDAGRGAV
jgi:hypothetical protein